jgi:hypothetical protein
MAHKHTPGICLQDASLLPKTVFLLQAMVSDLLLLLFSLKQAKAGIIRLTKVQDEVARDFIEIMVQPEQHSTGLGMLQKHCLITCGDPEALGELVNDLGYALFDKPKNAAQREVRAKLETLINAATQGHMADDATIRVSE